MVSRGPTSRDGERHDEVLRESAITQAKRLFRSNSVPWWRFFAWISVPRGEVFHEQVPRLVIRADKPG